MDKRKSPAEADAPKPKKPRVKNKTADLAPDAAVSAPQKKKNTTDDATVPALKKPRKKKDATDQAIPDVGGSLKKPRKKKEAQSDPPAAILPTADPPTADPPTASLIETTETDLSLLCGAVGEDGALTAERRTVKVSPALIGFASEAFGRALADNVRTIKITVTDASIAVWCDGDGIPCGIHPQHADMPIPQVEFSKFLTFSRKLIVKVKHAATGDTYEQAWADRGAQHGTAKVKKGSKATGGFVSFTFEPVADLLGGGSVISDDTRAVLMHRAMEMSLAAPKGVRVVFNETPIKCESIKRYVQTVVGGGCFVAVDEADSNWLVGVAIATDPVSYGMVNGISAGGIHIQHVLDRIKAKLLAKKRCGDVDHLSVFVSARVMNPTFEGRWPEVSLQACDWLNDYRPSDAFVAKIASEADVEKTQAKLLNRDRFISAVKADPSIVFGKTRAQLDEWMESEGFDVNDKLCRIPIGSFGNV